MIESARTSGGRIAGGQVHGRGMVEWLTPPPLLKALGSFDLDPCSPVNRPWDTAAKHYTVADDGLSKPWNGRIWLNPPYDDRAETWLERLANHGNGIALLFARTDTKAFHTFIWGRADAVLFIRGRVQFHRVDGTVGKCCGAPSILVAYGKSNVHCLRGATRLGAFIELPGRWI
jgi:hypothetical protein